MGTILIVDDDASLRKALLDRLGFWGHTTFEAKDGATALKLEETREFDLILLDLAMPGLSGMEVLAELKNRGSGADVVILTAHGSVESAVEALKLGAADFLLKPADFEFLRKAVDRLLEKRRLQRVNRALHERIEEPLSFLGAASPGMVALLETAARAAKSNATILLTGESGSGKQVLAEYVHRRSNRSNGPFVYVNCVALSDELIESTLFGHEKGAFTGAVARKEGRLEAAGGGTAFLDEVGDITPRLQTKLLHFLETNEFERVGGTQTLNVDCRIIAATNRNLEAAVRDGSFRQDLYFRLHVIHLAVPPLRQRPEDIALLAQAFVERFARELGRGTMTLDPRTLRILQSYAWPGNVRQLRNVIERMTVLALGNTLSPELLPPEVSGAGPVPTDGVEGWPSDDAFTESAGSSVRPLESTISALSLRAIGSLKQAVGEFKREYIRQALAQNGGNQTRTAEQLGLQRTFLNRLVKEYKL